MQRSAESSTIGALATVLTLLSSCVLACGTFAAAADYTTFHYDNARDGWNNTETGLKQSGARRITEYASYALDGEVDAQPLYLHAEYIPSTHSRESVVYVVTQNDTAYAIAPGHGVLWSRNFGASVGTRYVGNCMATSPTLGIAGTPVIDRATDTMYLVSYTLRNGAPSYTLHAISPGTGAEKMSAPIPVGDPSAHHQRAGLLESQGRIYVAFAGFCDHHVDASYGRILAYSARNLHLERQFITTSSPRCGDFHLGTIWALGFGPAADARGNVYFATGNGCIDYAHLPDGGYSDAVLRLTSDLRLTNTTSALFAPCGAFDENRHDQEIGSGGVVLVPRTQFLLAGGKTGITYVLDRSNLGGFHSPCPDRARFEMETNWGIWGGPVAWKSGSRTFVALAGTGPHGLRSYALDGSSGRLTLISETNVQLLRGGESTIVTSDRLGTPASQVLWLLTRPTTGAIYLQAYDPRNLARPLVSVVAGSWGNPFGYAPSSPTVVDGYVFVASNKQLTIWR